VFDHDARRIKSRTMVRLAEELHVVLEDFVPA